MIQPNDLKTDYPIDLVNGIVSTTATVWSILVASYEGNIERILKMTKECPELLYAQYNYTPPIHFAVREGHVQLVKYLLQQGAHDPSYRIYPFLDNLQTIATDRGYHEIAQLLQQYADTPDQHRYKGDCGRIHFPRTTLQQEFEEAVHKDDLNKTAQFLQQDPGLVLDETFFWGEGILCIPAQHQQFELLKLLMRFGARVPNILKWTQFYYFKFYDSAIFLLENGMDPNVKSWHHVTILHDMAQKNDLPKAELLIKHGADINALEEEYQSTPLGLAVRWGHEEMVAWLLKQGADPNRSGAGWSRPLAWAQQKEHAAIEKILSQAGAA